MEEDILEIADAHAGYRGMAEAGRSTENWPAYLRRKQTEVEKLKDHIRSMVHGCASFRFLLQLQRR